MRFTLLEGKEPSTFERRTGNSCIPAPPMLLRSLQSFESPGRFEGVPLGDYEEHQDPSIESLHTIDENHDETTEK